jgi:transposase
VSSKAGEVHISKITEATRNAKAKKIFIGLEATGHYQNLTLRLRSLGYDVAATPLTPGRKDSTRRALRLIK